MSLLVNSEASLSTARLRSYRVDGAEPNEAILGRYLWNVALGEALYPTLNFVEVLVRNSLHGAIASLAGARWFDNANVLVDQRAREDIAEAKRRLAEAGRSADPPDVIAALDFGFWTGLCNREYEQGFDRPVSQIALWPPVLRLLGTALPAELRTRAALSEFLGRVRIIRNRVSHYEPIWRGHPDRRGRIVPLSFDHGRMRGLVGALSPHAGELLELTDRFPHEYERGPEPWVSAVRDLCGARGYAA